MDSLFDNKLTLGAAGAGAVLLGVLAVFYIQRADVRLPAAQPLSASAWDGPIGPGALAGAVREPRGPGQDLQAAGAPRLALDASGHLVPDLALRRLMDSFLVAGKGAQRQARAAELRAYLKGLLTAPAVQEAQRIAVDYLAYLEAEERMLARERFARPDPAGLADGEVTHLLEWQRQRAQLRERILGSAVAKAWFDADDAACAAALGEWQKQRVPLDGAQEPDPVELRERRIHGAVLEQRRNENAQACASQVMEGLAAR